MAKKVCDWDYYLTKFELLRGDKFDYSAAEFIDSKTKIQISCRIHPATPYFQSVLDHLKGNGGCLECRNDIYKSKFTLTIEQFLEKAKVAHGDRYGYAHVIYENAGELVDIECHKHGIFKQTPARHWSGNNCPTCAHEEMAAARKLSEPEFLEELTMVHGDKFIYNYSSYKNQHERMEIMCQNLHVFEQSFIRHVKSKDCPICLGKDPLDNNRLNTEKFKVRALQKHDSKYGYDNSICENSDSMVEITCFAHGVFFQNAGAHLAGRGCYECGREVIRNSKLDTTETFTKKAIAVHGAKYTYDLVRYINTSTPVSITCQTHGMFNVVPNNFLAGQECPDCTKITTKEKLRWTREEFIERAILVHGDQYIYDNVVYETAGHKVQISCKNGHTFFQAAGSHLSGNGCYSCSYPKRSLNMRNDPDEFITRSLAIHEGYYDYTNTVYVKSDETVTITCPKHGDFIQKPCDHLLKKGCMKCAKERNAQRNIEARSTTTEFIEKAIKIHGDKFDYSLVEYISAHKKVNIVCNKKGHNFWQKPSNHLSKKGCNACNDSVSKIGTAYLDYLGTQEREVLLEMHDGSKIRVDGYERESNTVVQFHGSFVHGHPLIFHPLDFNSKYKEFFGDRYLKTLQNDEKIVQSGYRLLVKWEHDWQLETTGKPIPSRVDKFEKVFNEVCHFYFNASDPYCFDDIMDLFDQRYANNTSAGQIDLLRKKNRLMCH